MRTALKALFRQYCSYLHVQVMVGQAPKSRIAEMEELDEALTVKKLSDTFKLVRRKAIVEKEGMWSVNFAAREGT